MPESTYRYTDEEVLEYFEEEKKSGCLEKSDKEADARYEKKLLNQVNANASKSKALEMLGLDETQVEEIAPVCFKGYEEKDGYYSRYGLDGKYRTSQYSVTWLFFGNEEIYLYYVFLDVLHQTVHVSSQEFFYKDVTSFYTLSDKYTVRKSYVDGKGCVEIHTVELNKFHLKVPGDSFSCSVSGVADADRIIIGLKQKIREKKQNG